MMLDQKAQGMLQVVTYGRIRRHKLALKKHVACPVYSTALHPRVLSMLPTSG